MKIALFGNVYQAEKNRYVSAVLRRLEQLGVEIVVEEKFADFISSHFHLQLNTFGAGQYVPRDADLAISVGGDGTFLGTAAQIGSTGIPILGINTGHLRMLAEISPEDIDQALVLLLLGQYTLEQCRLIQVSKDGEPLRTYPFALNEVAVLKHDVSSLIEIRTMVGDELLAKYLADGLIVCTPTGSTGYSLSVGGPVIEPRSNTFCISAVAPHSLTVRPVILCDDVEIRLSVKSRSHNFLISVDGRSDSYPDGTEITLRRAPYTVGVVKIMHRLFFDTLREKMMWGADRRGR